MNVALRQGKDLYVLKFRTKGFAKTYRWIEQKVLVYRRDKNNRVNQILVVSKDIQKQVLAKNRVQKLNNELIGQNATMKKINAELDQFVYSASHDLRAPLASILGLVNLSKLETNPNDLKGYMNKIGFSIEKLDGFIQDILNYSKNSRTVIDKTPIKLESLLLEIIDNIKLINNNGIKLKVTSKEDIIYVGDKRRLSIILNNLLSNAYKYADSSKLAQFLKVSVRSSKSGCNFIIEDNGIGINKVYQDKIFDMFYRATEKSNGSGIGLYIVKEVVSKLKGDIKIESKEGIGTKVFLELPHTTNNSSPP